VKRGRTLSRTRYTLKRPTGARRSFAIMVDTVHPDGRRVQRPLEDERVAAINKLLKAEAIKPADAYAQMLDLLDKLRTELKKERGGLVFHDDNLRLLEKYWQQEYASRKLVRLDSARHRLEQAMGVMGSRSLLTSSRQEIQNALDAATKDKSPSVQRNLCSALTQLLRFAGRLDIKLEKARKGRRQVAYLTLDQFMKVREHLSPEYRALFGTCFATGARIGEAFGLLRSKLHKRHVYIDCQEDRKFDLRDTKTVEARSAPFIPELKEDVEAWLDIHEREHMRNVKHCDVLRAACSAAKVRGVKVHDLRHSYAIHLLGRGVSLSLVAQSLGNSDAVCQEYYAGFVLKPEAVEMVASLL
jgi:integrase